MYAIHWGWPGETVVIPNVTPAEDAKIRMLGVAKDLEWQQSGSDVVIHTPAAKPCNYAYAFRIPLAR